MTEGRKFETKHFTRLLNISTRCLGGTGLGETSPSVGLHLHMLTVWHVADAIAVL